MFVGLTTSFCLVVTIVIAEGLARLFVPLNRVPTPPAPQAVDPYKGNPYLFGMRPYLHVYIPGVAYESIGPAFRIVYHINHRGFRGPEVAPREDTRLKRLVVIGDSIVEGHGVEFEQGFIHLLDRDLRNTGWEVLNAGVAGGSPIYYAANVPRYLALQPDAALIVIFENDLGDDRRAESTFFSLPLLDDDAELLGSARKARCCRSRLYVVLRRVWRGLEQSAVGRIVVRNRSAGPLTNEEQAAWHAIAPYLIAPSMINQQWSMSQPYLDHVVESFRSRGISVLIAGLCLGTFGPGLNDAYHVHCNQVNGKVAAWAKARGLPFLSLLPTIARLFQDYELRDIMIEADGHPTKMTHAAIESALRPWIIGQLAPVMGPRGRD